MKHTKKLFLSGSLACLILAGSQASAQILTPHLPQNKWLTLAEEQFLQGHYSSAAQSAGYYISANEHDIHNRQADALDKAHYYLTVSALKLARNGCIDSALQYIATTANPAYKQRTAYALAQYYFQNNQLAEAIPYYEMAGISNLTNAEIANARFELAYAYFTMKQFDKAEPLFASIKQLASSYTAAGNYYYGLLAYNQGNYKDALESFEKVKDEKQYKNIVPYYIAEIRYFMGDRKRALDDALKQLKSSDKSYYDNELHLLAAQVLFEEQRYGDALPYFEHYYDHVERIRKEDLYEMAYSYYRVNEWENAIDKFKPLSNTRDSLGQTAMYLLGDAYLKTGDKKSARNAFSIASDMSFSPAQQEAALLLAAKLSYEMGYYDEAVTYINTLLSSYPNSSSRDEAKTILSALLIKTSNYAEAYKTLKEVTNQDAGFWPTWQKVTYGYAMLQIQNGNTTEADNLLSQSLRQPTNEMYEAAANFWKGEIAYRSGRPNDAIQYSEKFIGMASKNQDEITYLSPSATLQNAYVNMGYAAMQLKDFAGAQNYFARAQQARGEDAAFVQNAMLREADAVFMQKDYARASALYDKIIAANGEDAAYARYQKAKLLGLQGKNAEKANMLQSVINQKPPSEYATDARYELALTYIEDNKYQQAISMLMPLTEAFEKRNMAPKAWMKIGFVYQQLNNNEKAIDAYRHVVSEYPQSEERAVALDALKSLYIENNEPGAYAQLLKDNNLSAPGNSSIDSAFYSAAENLYAAGKYSNARQSFTQYLQQYPNGIFVNKAHYYAGESHYQLKEYNDALTEYAAVLANPWNDFTENSAKRASAIAYQQKDYTNAAKYYLQLRNATLNKDNLQMAYNGLMQSNFNLGNYDVASAYADTLSALPGLDEHTLNNVLLYKARSLQRYNKPAEAQDVYKRLAESRNSAIAAEARYHISEIHLQLNQLKEAEEAANSTIKLSGGNDYWIVKSYILLADIMSKQKDYFNAKATLQSIIKNTGIAELKKEAAAKLEEVKTLEKKQSKLSEE